MTEQATVSKCCLESRKDDIPKKSRREKSWHCLACGVLLFSVEKPDCVRGLVDSARQQAAEERQRLHIED